MLPFPTVTAALPYLYIRCLGIYIIFMEKHLSTLLFFFSSSCSSSFVEERWANPGSDNKRVFSPMLHMKDMTCSTHVNTRYQRRICICMRRRISKRAGGNTTYISTSYILPSIFNYLFFFRLPFVRTSPLMRSLFFYYYYYLGDSSANKDDLA